MHPAPTPAGQRDDHADTYRAVLHELIEVGATLARALPQQVTQPTPATAADLALAYERIARAIRRTIALARTLDQPAPPLTARRSTTPSRATLDDAPSLALSPEHYLAAREHIAREVEDAIEIEYETRDPSEATLLRAELREVLADPGLDWDIEGQPTEDVIADICLNLGLDDIRDLRARAAQRSPEAASGPAQPAALPPRTPLTRTSTGPPAP